jgi:dephospho-CoA kinase
MNIIGITGTHGAGKGTLVDYLAQEKGYVHYSVRSFLADEALKRGVPQNRDSYLSIANELRKQFHPGIIAEMLYKKAAENGNNCVIESIRTIGEIETLKKLSDKKVKIIAVDADPHLRYTRIVERKSVTDNVTFEQFIIDEKRESNVHELWESNLPACISHADIVLTNNGTLEEFHSQIEKTLSSLLEK